MSGHTGTNVPHLNPASAEARQQIKSSSKAVAEDPASYEQQPAVVAPILAHGGHAPVPVVEQNAQTGPETIGDDDPTAGNVPKKPSVLGKILHKLKR